MDIGTKIKKRRKELGLTQAALAEPDFTRGFISQIENGLVTKPPFKTLEIIANKLAIPTTSLLEDQTEPPITLQQNKINEKIKICKRLIHLKRYEDTQMVIDEMNKMKTTEYIGDLNELQGSLLYAQEKYKEAISFFEEAIVYLNTSESLHFFEVYQNLSNCYMKNIEYDKAIDAGFYALSLFKKLNIKNELLEIQLLYVLAVCHCRRNEFKQGLKYIEEALLISNSTKISYNYGNFKMLQGLGNTYLKDYEKGIHHTIEAIKFLENPKEIIGCLTNLGILYRYQNNNEFSKNYLKQSLQKSKKEKLNWHIQNNLYELSTTYFKSGKMKRAFQAAEESLFISEDKILSGKALYNIGCFHLKSKSWDEAILKINESLEIFKEHKIARWEAMAISKLGIANFEKGEYNSSHSLMKQALEKYDLFIESM